MNLEKMYILAGPSREFHCVAAQGFGEAPSLAQVINVIPADYRFF
jgi:hypothetical protein